MQNQVWLGSCRRQNTSKFCSHVKSLQSKIYREGAQAWQGRQKRVHTKLYAQTACLSIQQTPVFKTDKKSLNVSLQSQFTCFCKSNINQTLPTAVVWYEEWGLQFSQNQTFGIRKQQLTLALSSVHRRQSIWLWIATLCQPFKSMEIQSTMYQILDTLVPWWHLAQVTSKGESHLLGVHSGSWNNFGRVHTYPLQQKLSCLIPLVSLYYSMAVNRGWSPRIWKTKSTPLLPHATESCWI